MQAAAMFPIRSRSPITSHENYALKLKMGYAVHPSSQNNSYYLSNLWRRYRSASKIIQ